MCLTHELDLCLDWCSCKNLPYLLGIYVALLQNVAWKGSGLPTDYTCCDLNDTASKLTPFSNFSWVSDSCDQKELLIEVVS